MQGDVFEGVRLAGFQELSLAIVISHPCSMRTTHGRLKERLLMARVQEGRPVPIPWHGHFGIMPLPELMENERPYYADFEELGTVASDDLRVTRRIAVLDDLGCSLLQQRFTNSVARYVVEAAAFFEQSAPQLAEAEILEDWLEAALPAMSDHQEWRDRYNDEVRECDAYLNEHREGLKRPEQRAAVRRAAQAEIKRRWGEKS